MKRASEDLLEARFGMVRRQEVEALLNARVVSHEVQMRHLQEKLSVRGDNDGAGKEPTFPGPAAARASCAGGRQWRIEKR